MEPRPFSGGSTPILAPCDDFFAHVCASSSPDRTCVIASSNTHIFLEVPAFTPEASTTSLRTPIHLRANGRALFYGSPTISTGSPDHCDRYWIRQAHGGVRCLQECNRKKW